MATSRVGRKPIAVPAGVDVKIQGQELHIKGPKGHTNVPVHSAVLVQIEDGHIKFQANSAKGYCRSGSGSRLNNSIIGTARATIANFVQGVTAGFERKLVLVGVGYRAQVKGKELHLTVGYSHPVSIMAPEGITIETPSQTEILVKGIDKHLVGHIASKIRAVRRPEPYKGKGIRYANEVIILKETKKK
ncbi:MAG TPA: 50S ribosomal protein L6 [Gammaproteobacteria bacterium]|nr:50S ribosomal protein L6 [Gammaproteobacteria bacterium]